MEGFNILNHPNFTTFTLTQNSSAFGNATAAADPRIFQLAGKINFYLLGHVRPKRPPAPRAVAFLLIA
jgi:hypothetical protein